MKKKRIIIILLMSSMLFAIGFVYLYFPVGNKEKLEFTFMDNMSCGGSCNEYKCVLYRDRRMVKIYIEETGGYMGTITGHKRTLSHWFMDKSEFEKLYEYCKNLCETDEDDTYMKKRHLSDLVNLLEFYAKGYRPYAMCRNQQWYFYKDADANENGIVSYIEEGRYWFLNLDS